MADRAVAAIVKLDVASRGLAFAAAFMKVAKLASEMQEEELKAPAPALHQGQGRCLPLASPTLR